MPLVVIRDEIGFGIRREAAVALVLAAQHGEGLSILAEAGDELVPHAKSGRSVAGAFLDAAEGESELTEGCEVDRHERGVARFSVWRSRQAGGVPADCLHAGATKESLHRTRR
jgi:hypothetical protein